MSKHIRMVLGLLQHRKQIQQAFPTGQRPPLKTPEEWRTYWQMRGQPWRTEPEIDTERQNYLAKRRLTTPNIEQGIYPFKDIEPKLTRADVEWLLATHENGRGPVDWRDAQQRNRVGVDLRGADLRLVDLHGLPLARLHGGLNGMEWAEASVEQRNTAKLHLEGANLSFAHLEGASLAGAHLERSNGSQSHLERTDLHTAHLEGTSLFETHLAGASLRGAFLDAATILSNILLVNEEFGSAYLSDVHWDDTNLSLVNWTYVRVLGDEHEAKQATTWYGSEKNKSDKSDKSEWIRGYRRAVRANRQLAFVLQNQGLNEEAARFAYRAQVLQKRVWWFQMMQRGIKLRQRVQALNAWLFSWFLFLLAGYGYKPIRSVLAYLVIIFGFMGLYLLNAHSIASHLTWDEALVLSVSSFHGRGFFTQNVTLGDTYARLAAVEAVVGLFIEISFIATFTQRFLGK